MTTICKIVFLLSALIFTGCGQSYERTRRENEQAQKQKQKDDSLALKIGVMPTLDCLPLYIAQEKGLFKKENADIRLKQFTAQINCDEALYNVKIEGCITDLVRAQRMKIKGKYLNYIAATNTYWQLISNKKARIRKIAQLHDKMIAIARFSAPALLADYATDSVNLKSYDVFKIQINDLNIRLQMLLNNEMDAMMLPEPQASVARTHGNKVLFDSREKDIKLGVIAFNKETMKGKLRKKQLSAFINGYNAACDSLNKNGITHYADILKKYYKIGDKDIKALPKMRFSHAGKPRQ